MLDSAVAAYTNIALLRQQVKPTNRIHGIFEGKDWATNSELVEALNSSCWSDIGYIQSFPIMQGCCELGGASRLVIFSNAVSSWYVRSETWADVEELLPRVRACFE